MNCDHVRHVLDASIDDELDTGTQADVRRHLDGCAACSAQRDERAQLREAFRRLPRYTAPPGAREAILRTLVPPPSVAPAARRWIARWRTPAWAGAAAALAFVAGLWVGLPVREPAEPVVEQALALHVASLRDDAPAPAVLSTDRHVVKPWFAGRLDFAPPVRDLSSKGYALLGGGIDRLAGRPAAALAYRVRKHRISLYVARAGSDRTSDLVVTSRRGFSVGTWAEGGLTFMAVADTDPAEIRRFAEAVRTPPP